MQAKIEQITENAVDIEKGMGITFYFLMYFICNAQETCTVPSWHQEYMYCH